MDFGVVITLVLAEALYLRALRILRARGYAVPRGQRVLWHLGMALEVLAFASPIHDWAEQLLSAHMVEHILIADLGAPLLLAGARWPVLLFYLPRPALVTLARQHWLRRALAALSRPAAAGLTYVVVLYGWHFSFAFEAAVRHSGIHVLQHLSFVAIGVLVWWVAIDPQRRRMRGDLWKVPYFLAVRFFGMMVGMAYVAIRVPVYGDVYGRGARAHGFTALGDQQVAGALMITVDILIMVFALCFFFLRAAQDADREERRQALLTSP